MRGVITARWYQMVEERLRPATLDLTSAGQEEVNGVIKNGRPVCITGKAAILDYSNLASFLREFNDVGQKITYVAQQEDFKEPIRKLKESVRKKSSRDAIQAAKHYENKMQEILENIAASEGLQLDDLFLEALASLTDHFQPDSYEFLVENPTPDGCWMRVPIARDWLRRRPSELRALFADYATTPWTVVGFPTSLRLPGEIDIGLQPGEKLPEAEAEVPAGLMSAYENMFRVLRGLNATFCSPPRWEVVVTPIAVFREYQIPAGPLGDGEE